MFMKQDCTPLYTAMKTYIEDKAMAFHTPGHKTGKGADRKLHEMITDMGLKMEVSLMEELDDIHGASTCIKAAQLGIYMEQMKVDFSLMVQQGLFMQ